MNFLIVDGNSIINRSFYAIKSLTNSRGQDVNGVYGFINIFIKHLCAIKPEYVAVAFDVSRKTFRTELFKEYKGTRKATPENLITQIKILQELLELAGYPVLKFTNFEADDIIGTLTLKFASFELKFSILTGDRDSFQLINPNVCVYLPTNKSNKAVTTIITEADVAEQTGVLPSQIVDLKALMGDTSDNIPGCAGIGPKKAADLISEFKTIENLYNNLEQVKTKSTQNQLIAEKDNVFLSKSLAEIYTDVPIDLNLDAYIPAQTDKTTLISYLNELDMKSIIQKIDDFVPHLAGQEYKSSSAEDLENFKFITDINSIKSDLLSSSALFVALNKEDNLLGINNNLNIYNLPLDANISALAAMLSEFSGNIFLDDVKEFYTILSEHKLSADISVFFCSTLAGYILYSTVKRYSLDSLVKSYLAPQEYIKFDSNAFVFGLLNMPALCKKMLELLKENEQLFLLQSVEIPLAHVLVQMEMSGVQIDVAKLIEFGKTLQAEIDTIDSAIFEYNDNMPFNVNSAAQLGSVLFERLKLPNLGKTKTGFKTDADSLAKISKLHPIIKLVLTHRQLLKLKSTYVDGLLKTVSPSGRVHSVFRQTETKTGRISSAEPNLQNIPIRTELGSRMRNFFIAPPGKLLIDADYSQIELRVLAEICKDQTLIEIFKSGQDIHKITAAEIFNVPISDVTDQMRRRAKAVNFGIIYGIGPFALAEDIDVSFKEASGYIKNYFARFPGVEKYTIDTVNFAKEHGFVCTLFNRRIHIPELATKNAATIAFGKRVAYNAPVQGTAADIIKIAMVNLNAKLSKENLTAKIILQVHDEIIVEAPEKEVEQLSNILRTEMENAAQFDIPLEVNIHAGKTWAESH